MHSGSCHFTNGKGRHQLFQPGDMFQDPTGNQLVGADYQRTGEKHTIKKNEWVSGEKADGSASLATAKGYLSDALPESNKDRSPLGEKSAVLQRGKPMEIAPGKRLLQITLSNCLLCLGQNHF